MRSESTEKQDDYFILGNRLFVNYNHEEKIRNIDGQEVISWVCDQVIIPKNSSRAEMIEAIIRNRYHSYGAELAAINSSETVKNEYLAFRQMAINIANVYFGLETETLPETPSDEPTPLLQYAATKRWETEIAGITFNGIPLYTDDRSKILIMGARSRAEKNSSIQEQWTAADGVIYTLNASTIISISDAIGEHVSRCFSKFAEVRGKINSSEITTYEQIDTEFASINTVY